MGDNDAAPAAPAAKKGGCSNWVFGGALVFFLFIYFFWPSDEEMAQIEAQEATEKQAALQAGRATAEKVTAQQLFDEVDANEIAALEKYKGKVIEVTGTVDGVDAGLLDQPTVLLQTSNQFMAVQAQLPKGQTDFAASLQKGQKVTLVCAEMTEAIGTPMLRDCVPG